MYKRSLQVLARESSFPVEEYSPSHFVVTPEIAAELRVKNYFDQWQSAIANRWFHVRLADQSLFLFTEGATPSYSFLHCPLDIMTFSEFLSYLGVENSPENRRSYSSEYEALIDTADRRESVTPIRFDYHPAGYRSGVHPVGHIHIGLSNEVRLSSNKMNAVAFVLFVMRHMYPFAWERLLRRFGAARLSDLIRHSNSSIPLEFWSVLDRVELHYR